MNNKEIFLTLEEQEYLRTISQARIKLKHLYPEVKF